MLVQPVTRNIGYTDHNEKELPGLRNGRLRREGTSWTSKWTLETRRTLKWTFETRSKWELPGLRNGRLRREGTSWTSKWTLETRRNFLDFEMDA
ncbi:unnamed protein product [Rhizophagus irregularis]|nr:unnamed protein product [Rhizophagus irregularis]